MAKVSKNKLNQLKSKLKKEEDNLIKIQENINDLKKQIESEQTELFMKTLKEAGVDFEEAIDTVLLISSDQQTNPQLPNRSMEDSI
ncbi:hypothetical protein P7H71_05010 [Lactococcus lactis]|jgi:predicted nuclease with TOPRIM domain|uniref:DUF4315 family protein n=1 Tax=Lactococcus lactis TaxID=1358 RepID=A0AAW8UGG0_9LACT|nr:hypothetical protein [Lactococcus lactis]KST90541.1 hypothetical protein LKF24_1992 [Lactococcus lactis subsp. lactis]MDT2861018.1 hypothetical protein [Lactococcus lactis]MDT2861956.1 hypothetical protein [Lactococcus lactis]MDT2869614.1 hypothetical protein [Lactococcus lactis]MDT2874857.1 hypothetical protein [Lactococcus lactis]